MRQMAQIANQINDQLNEQRMSKKRTYNQMVSAKHAYESNSNSPGTTFGIPQLAKSQSNISMNSLDRPLKRLKYSDHES